MGACTFTRALGAGGVLDAGETFDDVHRDMRVVRGLLTFSASYATGGDSLPLASIGLVQVTRIMVDPNLNANDSGLSIKLAGTSEAPLVKAFETNATEVANTTNLSTRTAQPVWIMGMG